MNDGSRPTDLPRTLLSVVFIGAMIAATFWVLQPFLTPVLWAAMIAVATWPLLLGLQARLWGKRGLAVTVLAVILLLILVVPIALAVKTVIAEARQAYAWIQVPGHLALPGPPAWLSRIPFAGQQLTQSWKEVAALGPAELAASLEPFGKRVVPWLAAQGGNVGILLLDLLLTLLACVIFYATGDTAARGVILFARRLAGEYGESSVVLAAKSVRAVALGVGVTALVQAGLGGIGLAVCGVPGAMVLTAVIFMLCIAQLGPMPILVPAVLWLYFWPHEPVWATALLVWTVLVGGIDNFLRPLLIKKGVDLPLVLIFAGVIGGLLGFGVIGLFIGPVVLAVAYTLTTAWVEAGDAP